MLIQIIFSFLILRSITGSRFEDFEVVWLNATAKLNGTRLGFGKSIDDGGGNYRPGSYKSKTYKRQPNPNYLSLTGLESTDSEVKCGRDNKNFCNYPDVPFIETLDFSKYLSHRDKYIPLPSGNCPVGYSKHPTFDCLNIAPALIESTCCVFDAPPIKLTDYCNNRQGIHFTASFELCDGRSFIIAEAFAWQVNDEFKILGGPYPLTVLTGGSVSANVDSALVDSSCNVGFFQGTQLSWLNFPDRAVNSDKNLLSLLGAVHPRLCGGLTCLATAVEFAVCPNNGFCLVSVNLTAFGGQVFQQLFLLAPGFNSVQQDSKMPPGIPVTSDGDLEKNFRNYISASYIRKTNQLAFVDRLNNVFFYDPTGKFISGPTNLFDFFDVCPKTPQASNSPYVFVPYPLHPVNEQYGPPDPYHASPNPYSQSAYNGPQPNPYGPQAHYMNHYGPPPYQPQIYGPPQYGDPQQNPDYYRRPQPQYAPPANNGYVPDYQRYNQPQQGKYEPSRPGHDSYQLPRPGPNGWGSESEYQPGSPLSNSEYQQQGKYGRPIKNVVLPYQLPGNQPKPQYSVDQSPARPAFPPHEPPRTPDYQPPQYSVNPQRNPVHPAPYQPPSTPEYQPPEYQYGEVKQPTKYQIQKEPASPAYGPPKTPDNQQQAYNTDSQPGRYRDPLNAGSPSYQAPMNEPYQPSAPPAPVISFVKPEDDREKYKSPESSKQYPPVDEPYRPAPAPVYSEYVKPSLPFPLYGEPSKTNADQLKNQYDQNPPYKAPSPPAPQTYEPQYMPEYPKDHDRKNAAVELTPPNSEKPRLSHVYASPYVPLPTKPDFYTEQRRYQRPKPAAFILTELNENTVFKPQFAGPYRGPFDRYPYGRADETDDPAVELKLL